MMDATALAQRPVVVAIAGPNGAGKSTFFSAFLKRTGLPFVNADVLANEHGLDPYDAARAADVLRRDFLARGVSFVFETVFSDPVGAKLGFLKEAEDAGFNVVLCFIGIADADVSEQRVCMRLEQGGHDVPVEKLRSRFPRTMVNLKKALHVLPHVFVYDNNDLSQPFRQIAYYRAGNQIQLSDEVPDWLTKALE